MKKTLVAAIAMTTWSLAWAAELAPGAPEVYVVQKGDTLWDIAGRYLQSPWAWPEVWNANPQVDNPHLIFPGDVLSLVYVAGQPRVQRTAGPGTARTVSSDIGGSVADAGNAVVESKLPDGTTRLSPKARVLSEGEAIPTLSREIIGPFLTDAKVVEAGAIEALPYVVASEGEHVVVGAGDRVYVRGIDTDVKTYSFFRPGKAYVDPDTEEVLGYEAQHVGSGMMVREGDPATFDLLKTNQEVRVGDRALPVDESHLNPVFMPQPSPDGVQARILSVYGGVTQIGQYNVVVINKGEREGIRTGHTMSVMTDGKVVKDKVGRTPQARPAVATQTVSAETPAASNEQEEAGFFSSIGNTISGWFGGGDSSDGDVESSGNVGNGDDIKLPNEQAGTIMVFRTFDKVSLALVMKATRPLHVGDWAVSPQ